MKKTAGVLLAGFVLLGLTGCGNVTEEEIKERARLIKVCKENGGDPYIPLLGTVECDMIPATK